MLKAAGVSDFIVREIVGHESAAVSRQYTHLATDDKRAAMPTVAGRDERLIATRCAAIGLSPSRSRLRSRSAFRLGLTTAYYVRYLVAYSFRSGSNVR